VKSSIALANKVETPSQPPTAIEPCPLWAEVKTLWAELIKINHKEAVVKKPWLSCSGS